MTALDPAQLPPAARPTLPVEPTDYLRFFRAPRFRWWKSALAIVAVALVWFFVSAVVSFVGIASDGFDSVNADTGAVRVGPGIFLANNLGLAASIPIVMLLTWAIVGQRPGWLSSVAGGFRWSWFARCALVALPLWAVLTAVGFVLGDPVELTWRDTTVFMILVVLLTTPLQSAGEEYLVRGFLGRAVGSWFAHPWVAFGVSTVVTASVFTALHAAADPWLNAYYVVFAVVASWLVLRTGGLEASVAIHIVNNMTGMVTLPFSDFSEMFDRGVGTGDASLLINMGVLVVAAAVIDWWARRRGVVRASAPGREQLAAVRAALAGRGWAPGPPPPGQQLPRPAQPPGPHQPPAAW
ncbi:CPBP family intramembrane glutamic endopeptidase [Propioniciclava soli]|uniref:Type II CAAX endopeptidase family protein n=1 Tax=Propioniciclava soli TaxID=2775081 RepID=A0ABZ3C3N8_9ACTN|nr:type II CAAX endopeptidase family protein [Propioniciclava soli]